MESYLSETTVYYLEQLTKTGTYGEEITDVVVGLIEEGVRTAINNKLILVTSLGHSVDRIIEIKEEPNGD